jgi:hypothetical protein
MYYVKFHRCSTIFCLMVQVTQLCHVYYYQFFWVYFFLVVFLKQKIVWSKLREDERIIMVKFTCITMQTKLTLVNSQKM